MEKCGCICDCPGDQWDAKGYKPLSSWLEGMFGLWLSRRLWKLPYATVTLCVARMHYLRHLETGSSGTMWCWVSIDIVWHKLTFNIIEHQTMGGLDNGLTISQIVLVTQIIILSEHDGIPKSYPSLICHKLPMWVASSFSDTPHVLGCLLILFIFRLFFHDMQFITIKHHKIV